MNSSPKICNYVRVIKFQYSLSMQVRSERCSKLDSQSWEIELNHNKVQNTDNDAWLNQPTRKVCVFVDEYMYCD